MLPATQANLVSLMYVNHAPRGVSPELARYVRSEYGANEAYALAILAGAKKTRAARSRGQSRGRFDGFVLRLLEAIRAPFLTARSTAGGA